MDKIKRPMINEALRLVRLYWGLSQAELAKSLDLSQSMISEIERGSKSVSMEVLEKYSSKLNIRMSQLLFFAEEIEDTPIIQKGKLFIQEKILKLLQALVPQDEEEADA